ncbi:BTB/POZ domain-containing protein 6-B-like [Dreissena polymorpha]|uniref:BTB domain-containing protein n=1 Tax=Dreissena polymorpha TaxID=45954 RepID=A0A9D4HPF7_DREPO|nr:BTB/POZ domain-containing protein 6-B-like [Dreissena polymorpha]KAH3726161.1 hypothetical protein DPMN_052017 [Dreissena polymorpha]
MSQSRQLQTERNNKTRANSNQTTGNRAEENPNGRSASIRSPAAISRTPSADRRLLRTLTVSPNVDNPTPEPDINNFVRKSQPVKQQSLHTQSRRSQGQHTGTPVESAVTPRQSRLRTPTESYVGSPNRTPDDGSADEGSKPGRTSRVVITLPATDNEIRADAWQSGKTVVESNSYMLKYEVACDVTFTVGESREEIRAHKYMLLARSPVLFKSLIKHMEKPDVRIDVPDIKPHNFRELLQYVYTDVFDIHSDNAPFMLYAARKFQLKGLSSLCFQFLDAEMHDETVCKIMEQAHIYNENGLYEKCVRYIYTNGNAVLAKPSFAELCSECVERIIKSDDLRASEQAVFEACVVWANAECRRQKKQATDETRRKVLGKLLYYVRFPVMDVTYFTQKVSLGQLLSHDETLSIFQFFHGEENQLPHRFIRQERNQFPRNVTENAEPLMLSTTSRSPSVISATRFPGTDGQWKQNGPPDAISFTVSQPIVLYGVEIYGAASGKETYALQILVYDDITREEIRKNDASLFTNSIKDKYEVYLARPLRIPPRRVFTVVVIMKGTPTHKGVDGERTLIMDGVTFEFTDSNRSSNGTDASVGQIPGILFNKTQ